MQLSKLLGLNNSFIRNVSTVMLGSLIAQSIPLFLSPILTRLYSPETFGGLAVFLLMVSVGSICATGRYESALYLPKSLVETQAILVLCVKLAALFSFFLLIVLAWSSSSLTKFDVFADLGAWIFFLPPVVFAAAIQAALTQYSIRLSEFKTLALSQVSQSFFNGLSSLSFAFKAPNSGLFIGFFVGLNIGTIYLLARTRTLQIFKKKGLKRELLVSARYSQFPLFTLPASLINILSTSMPLIFLTAFFGLSFAGYLTLVQRIVIAPSTLVGNAFGQVFQQQASQDIRDRGSARALVVQTTRQLALFSFLPFFLFFLFVPAIFTTVFGEEWHAAGKMAQTLMPMAYIRFVTMPVASILLLRNKPGIDFMWQLTFLILACGAYFFREDLDQMIVYFSATSSFMYVLSFLINFHFAKEHVEVR